MHLQGRAAVVTGGTAGIGLATGLALGRAGARVYLTHRWGSHDEGSIGALFTSAGAAAPIIVEADVSNADDTVALLEQVRRDHDGLHILVSNAAFGHVSSTLADLTQSALDRTMGYCAWPFVGYLQRAIDVFGAPPRYAIGISSQGPRQHMPGYTFLAAAKAVMETYCRYLSAALLHEPININVVAANFVRTASFEATFGASFAPFCARLVPDDWFIEPEEVAATVLALTSGLMDGFKGQVIELDRGYSFDDHVPALFLRREALGLDAGSTEDPKPKENP